MKTKQNQSYVPENWKGKVPKKLCAKCPDCGTLLAVGVKNHRGKIQFRIVRGTLRVKNTRQYAMTLTKPANSSRKDKLKYLKAG